MHSSLAFHFLAGIAACLLFNVVYTQGTAEAHTDDTHRVKFLKPDRIRYDARSLIIDDKPVFVHSGAMHYFRCPPGLWKTRLIQLKAAGLNCVETYLAWNFHEPEEPANPGDFSKLRRMEQISDFIQTARDLGLYVIIRPGPYICAEVDRGGYPGWLMNHRPEGLRPGHFLRGNSLEKLKWEQHWLAAAAKVVKPHLITNLPKGSPGVILWQIENEYDWTFAGIPSDVRTDVLRVLAQASLDNGIDVPLFTCETSDPAFRSDPLLRAHVFNTTNKYPGYDMKPLIDAIEYVAKYQPEAFRGVTELQGGWFSEAGGVLSEQMGHNAAQLFQLALTSIERGCTFINYYMFYGGSNFGDIGAQRLTQSYDYNAPLREWGGEQDRYFAVKAISDILQRHGQQLIHSEPVELNIEGDHPDVSIYLRKSTDGSRFYFLRNTKQHESRSGEVKVHVSDGPAEQLTYSLSNFEAKVLYVPAAKGLAAGEWLPKTIEQHDPPADAAPALAPVRVVSIDAIEPANNWRGVPDGQPLHAAGVFNQRYVHYRATFQLSAGEISTGAALRIRSRGGIATARVNGFEAPVKGDTIALDKIGREGENKIEILFENFGCPRFGPVVEETQGIMDISIVPLSFQPRPLEGWRMKQFAPCEGEAPEVSADFDDSDWQNVNLTEPTARAKQECRTVYRTTLPVSKDQLSAGTVLSFERIRDIGKLYVNGKPAGIANNWLYVWAFDVTQHLREGNNCIVMVVQSDADDGGLSQGCKVEAAGRRLTGVEVSPDTVKTSSGTDPSTHRRMLVRYALEFELPDAASATIPRKLHLQADANAFMTLNGHDMGRYWAEGPQRDIWLPECWLNFGPGTKNIIDLQARPTVDSPMNQIIKFAEVRPYQQATQTNEASPDTNVQLSPDDSLETVLAKAAAVRPTARQIAWQRDEISAFIHFGMNTFTDREWGDGREDPKLFNPTEFDAMQWVRAAKAAGITRMILTAKHHDGFCLWPSKFTEHSVKNSPWKDGKGDIVKEFIDACRIEGMHYGIYLSPWDRHEPSYGDSPKYNQYFLNQLREVLTTYPGIEEVWFDGACAEGPNGRKQEYDWRAYWQLIRELTPNAVISVRGPDVRWCGNEAGHARKSEWSVIPMPGNDQSWETSDRTLSGFLRDIYGDDLGSRDVLMRSRQDCAVLLWYPSQVNTSIRPGWFYHRNEDDRVRSVAELLSIYFGSVGGNGQFLLNIPPDRRGLFHENDVARLKQFGDVLKSTFAEDFAENATLTTEVAGGTSVNGTGTITDGNPDTFWTTSDSPAAASIMVELPAAARVNCLMLQEHIASGQRVEAFEVDAFLDGQWNPIAKGTVIGHKRLVRFADATISKLRIRFTQFRVRPTLANLGLYFAPAVLAGPRIVRDINGMVTIEPPDGACAHYTLDGTDPTEDSPLYIKPFSLPQGGLLIAQAFPLTPGRSGIPGATASTTRMEYGPAKAKWTIIDCTSQDADGKDHQAIDDNPKTIWHTRHRDGTDPMPHHIAVDLGESMTIFGFAYMPRQDQWENGIILRARFEVSRDGKGWTTIADNVDFDNIVNSRQQQVVRLPESITARYFRLTALRTAHDNNVATAADVSVLIR